MLTGPDATAAALLDNLALNKRIEKHASCQTHRCQCVNGVVHFSSPCEVVVPENAGDAGVCEDVSIACAHVVRHKRPVVLCGACVMVVNKGDCTAWPPASRAKCGTCR